MEGSSMRRIGFIAFPNFQVLSLSTLSVFECANMLAPEPLYDVLILSETGGPIRTSSGLTLETERFDGESDELAAPSRRACPPARSGRYRASATQRRADHADTDSHRRPGKSCHSCPTRSASGVCTGGRTPGIWDRAGCSFYKIG